MSIKTVLACIAGVTLIAGSTVLLIHAANKQWENQKKTVDKKVEDAINNFHCDL